MKIQNEKSNSKHQQQVDDFRHSMRENFSGKDKDDMEFVEKFLHECAGRGIPCFIFPEIANVTWQYNTLPGLVKYEDGFLTEESLRLVGKTYANLSWALLTATYRKRSLTGPIEDGNELVERAKRIANTMVNDTMGLLYGVFTDDERWREYYNSIPKEYDVNDDDVIQD